MTCYVDGCGTKARSKKSMICEKHYYRLRRTGTLDRSLRETTGNCMQCGIACERVFCSDRCRRRNSRGRVEGEIRQCVQCEESLPPESNSNKKYCSDKCMSKWRYHNVPGAKEYAIEASRLRRARKFNAVGCVQQVEFDYMCDFYDHVCLKCGDDDRLVPDHIVALSRGGQNWIANIQPLCHECNSKKWANSDKDYRWDEGFYFLNFIGYLISTGVDPEFNMRYDIDKQEREFRRVELDTLIK